MNLENELSARIARFAQLAMLLEVSASPKPGNVDRDHDYPDTCYEHFLASAVGVYPVLEKAAKSRKGIGTLLRQAVSESTNWQKGGNTHFGAFLLLIPLAMAAGKLLEEKGNSSIFGLSKFSESGLIETKDFEALASSASSLVQATDSEDAVEFYRAFAAGGVRVKHVEEFDLEKADSTAKLRENKVSLYSLMELSKGYDLLANEWTTGFGRCFEGAKLVLAFLQARNGNFDSKSQPIFQRADSGTGINEAVVYTFLSLLSRYRDSFIQTKFDAETADRVSSQARLLLSTWEKKEKLSVAGLDSSLNSNLLNSNLSSIAPITAAQRAGKRDFEALLPALREFDSELLEKRINPGSTADIIIAALFIALLGGLRF